MAHCPDCGSLVRKLEANGDLVPDSPYKAFTCPGCGAILGVTVEG